MKICIIGKYPPIEGGVSSNNYWLACALAQKGHNVFVVTNAEEVEPAFREEILPKDAGRLEPHNVKIFNTYPAYNVIPACSAFIAKLASLAIDLVRQEKIDVIYSNYLLPYGVAAGLVKQATGVPWFLDHAGSDITSVFDEPLFKAVLIELFKNADLVADTRQVREKLLAKGLVGADKIAPFTMQLQYLAMKYRSFSPKAKPFNLASYFHKFDKKLPVFTFFGKISSLKKTASFIEAAAYLPKGKFYLFFVTERGPGLIRLRNLVNKSGLIDYTCFLPFQPPWMIPALMTASTCVVAPESEEEPYLPANTHGSNIGFEAMLCGRCVVVGKKMSKKSFYPKCRANEHFLVVDPMETKSFTKKIKAIIDNPSLAARIGKQARLFWESEIASTSENTDVFLKNMNIAILKSRRR
jgi:glycosyltransferase involved in cell wall biosynthesis